MASQLYIWGKHVIKSVNKQGQMQSLAQQRSQCMSKIMNNLQNLDKDYQKQNKHANTIMKKVLQQQIQEASCGKQHFVLRCNRNVFVAGDNSKGQLGLVKHLYQPIGLTKLQINSLQLSKQPSLVFEQTRKTNFKSLGKYKNTQISLNKNQVNLCQNISIKAVSCGAYHTLLLTQNGEVLSSGQGKNGALGYGDGENSYCFKSVMKGVIKISAGADHSLALTKTKVYGWGSSKEGQLGIQSKRIFYTPKQLNVYPSKDIFAGNRFSFFNTIKGVFGTGNNNQGQLGLGHQNTVFSPKRLNIDEQIVKIQGNCYIIAVNKNNQGLLWGNGSFGKFLFPTKLQFITDISQYTISQSFGLVRTQSGKILVWGDNTDDQICIPQKNQQYAIQNETLSDLNISNFVSSNNFVIGWKKIENIVQVPLQKGQTKNDKKSVNLQQENAPSKIMKRKQQNKASLIRTHSRNNSQDIINRNHTKAQNEKYLSNTEAAGFDKRSKPIQQQETKFNRSSFCNQTYGEKKSNPLLQSPQFHQQNIHQNRQSYKNQQNYQYRIFKNAESQFERLQAEKSDFKPMQSLTYINQSKHSLKVHDTTKKIVQATRKENRSEQLSKLNNEIIRLKKENDFLRREKVMKMTYEFSGIDQISYQNQMLKRQSQKKSAYITKIRQEYLLLLDIVQNNKFLKSVLHLKDPDFPNHEMQLYHEGAAFQSQTKDQFTRQMAYLKEILQSAYKN